MIRTRCQPGCGSTASCQSETETHQNAHQLMAWFVHVTRRDKETQEAVNQRRKLNKSPTGYAIVHMACWDVEAPQSVTPRRKRRIRSQNTYGVRMGQPSIYYLPTFHKQRFSARRRFMTYSLNIMLNVSLLGSYTMPEGL